MNYSEVAKAMYAPSDHDLAEKIEAIEAIVEEAVRRTMEKVTGRKEGAENNHAKADARIAELEAELADCREKIGIMTGQCVYVNSQMDTLERSIEKVRSWAEENLKIYSREDDRSVFQKGWDTSGYDNMKQLLSRLPSFDGEPYTDEYKQGIYSHMTELEAERDTYREKLTHLEGVIEGLRYWAESTRAYTNSPKGSNYLRGWDDSTCDKMTLLLHRLPPKE